MDREFGQPQGITNDMRNTKAKEIKKVAKETLRELIGFGPRVKNRGGGKEVFRVM